MDAYFTDHTLYLTAGNRYRIISEIYTFIGTSFTKATGFFYKLGTLAEQLRILVFYKRIIICYADFLFTLASLLSFCCDLSDPVFVKIFTQDNASGN